MITLTEGKYMIDLQFADKDSEEASGVASYLAKRAVITREKDLLTMTLMVLDHGTVLGLQLEGNNEWVEADESNVHDEDNRRFELFELHILGEVIGTRAQYEYNHEGRTMKADEELRLILDPSSLEEVD